MTLLQNPKTAQFMGECGRRYAIEHRSYAVIADAVERRMLDIIVDRC